MRMCKNTERCFMFQKFAKNSRLERSLIHETLPICDTQENGENQWNATRSQKSARQTEQEIEEELVNLIIRKAEKKTFHNSSLEWGNLSYRLGILVFFAWLYASNISFSFLSCSTSLAHQNFNVLHKKFFSGSSCLNKARVERDIGNELSFWHKTQKLFCPSWLQNFSSSRSFVSVVFF